MKNLLTILFCFCPVFLLAEVCFGQQSDTINDPYADNGYMQGRLYYAIRSGQVKMMVQADKVGTSPAFSYLLFDAQNPANSQRKNRAYNYTPETKFFSSVLRVRMKDFAFAPLGSTCSTRWINEDGIPSVEATWWASGFSVREVLTPIGDDGSFRRRIVLKSSDLVAKDSAFVQLQLPEKAVDSGTDFMLCRRNDAYIGIRAQSNYPVTITDGNTMEIGPIVFSPGDSVNITSYLLMDLNPSDKSAFISKLENIPASDEQKTRQLAEKWQRINQLQTPDQVVSDLYRTASYSLHGVIGNNGVLDAGPFEYGAQWVRDASLTALGLIHTGDFELSRAMLENILTTMITDEGITMIGSDYNNPDREEFDQMGEFIYTMKSYVDWSGDVTLLKQYRERIRKMVERPLRPVFRDETGMLHNRIEFWERTFSDAYEMVYQMWTIIGLRCAADLSLALDAQREAKRWRKEADVILEAMLHHPTAKLIDDGHLIKRRNAADKQIVSIIPSGWGYGGAPGGVEKMQSIYPDATMALPVALNVIDPQSELARLTILETEKLWNQRWSFGGHDRYHTSSQGDQPGPWAFATAFIMRGEHEAGMYDYSRRSLEWLYNVDGGKSGLWYEEIPIIPSIYPVTGMVVWTTGEVTFFMIHHLLGIKFDGDRMTIKPNLYETTAPVKADLRYKDSRIHLEITGGNGAVDHAMVNGKKMAPDKQGRIVVPAGFKGGEIKIIMK